MQRHQATGPSSASQASPPGPRRRSWPYGLAYGLVALIAAGAVTRAHPMWFRDDDGPFLQFAATRPIAEAFDPATGSVQEFYRPTFVAAFYLAYHAFGRTYWPYQFIQLLVTFGIWAAFFAMLRGFWGRSGPAWTTAVLHPFLFSFLYYFTFRFSQLNYQLELLLGFTAAAVAARGWRSLHRPAKATALLLAALVLTELTYAAKEPSCVWLPILHAGAALLLTRRGGRRMSAPLRWCIGGWLLALAALTAWHLWLVKAHMKLLAVSGAFAIDAGFVLKRLRFYADLVSRGSGGWALMALAALACAAQAARIARRRRLRWLLVPLSAAGGAALCRFVHPIVPVLGASAAVAPAIPFALAALALVIVTAELEPSWSLYILQATWLMTAALVAAVFYSPLPSAVRRLAVWWRRRVRLDLRLVAAAPILAVLAAFTPSFLNKAQALRITSWRRCIARDLTERLIAEAPPRATVALAEWTDISTTHAKQHLLPVHQRAGALIQWHPEVYGRLLSAFGRADIVPALYAEIKGPGWYVLATSWAEVHAAQERFAQFTGVAAVEPRVVATAEVGRQCGRLWYLQGPRGK